MEKRDSKLLVFSSVVLLSLAFTLQSCCSNLSGTTGPPGEPASLSEPPRIISFDADPPGIDPGGTSTLKWETYNASSISISGLGAQPPSGRQKVRPKESTTYVLIATNAAGQTKKEVTVYLAHPVLAPGPPEPPPRIITFNASPPEIVEGGASILAWETKNASSISISGLGAQPPSGSKEVRPKKSTAYELTVANSEGKKANQKIMVTVVAKKELAPPEQLSPAPGAVFSHYPRKTALKWRKVPGAVSYTVEIDCFNCCVANQWCTDVGREYRVIPSIKTMTYKFDFGGAQPGRWRVWAVDKNGVQGIKSAWRDFRYTR